VNRTYLGELWTIFYSCIAKPRGGNANDLDFLNTTAIHIGSYPNMPVGAVEILLRGQHSYHSSNHNSEL